MDMETVKRTRGSIWKHVRIFMNRFSKKRADKIKAYFQRGFGVDEDIFNVIDLRAITPSWNPSMIDIVAVLSIGTTTLPFSETVELLDRFIYAGWIEKNVDAFSQLMMQTSKAFYGQGWDREAGRLLKLGEVSANRYQRKALEAQFRREIDRRMVSRLRDQSFLPQRGQ